MYTLLIRSLERIAPDDGLRLRLCLDESLVDLPWEFLYRPDAVDQDRLNGFLVLNPRISLVARRAPTITHKIQPSRRKQRLVFAGTLWPGGEDRWEVKKEYRLLSQGLASVKEFLLLEDYISDSGEQIEQALSRPSDIFHFSGHTDEADGRGYLCKEIYPPNLRQTLQRTAGAPVMEVRDQIGRGLQRLQ